MILYKYVSLSIWYLLKCLTKIKVLFLNYVARNQSFGLLYHKGVIFNPKTIRFKGYPYLDIHKNATVKIGDYFVCVSNPYNAIDCYPASKICVREGAKLIIGKYSGMTNSVIQCHESITIGDYVNIGAGCMIMDTNFHSTGWRIRANREEDTQKKNVRTSPVTLEDYVFIGARSIICKGVTIGEKSIVAAGSVVVKSIPKGEIWGGNPAKFITKISNS